MKQGRFSVDGIVLTCRHTRDFSSRYCSILAPSMAPRLLKWMSMYFPKRLELSLRMVFALPKAYWTKTIRWGGSQTEMMRFVMHFSCTVTDLPEWVWPPGPAALSRSVGRWWLPGTAGSAWCSPSFQLQTRRWKTQSRMRPKWWKSFLTLAVCAREVTKPDDAALVLVVALHVEVAVVGDCKYVRRHLADLLVGVEADLIRSVDGEQLVGVDRHQDGAGVRLQEAQTQRRERAVKCHSAVSPLTCRHFPEVWFDSNYEMLVSRMAGYFYRSNQSSLFQNVKKPNYAGKSKKRI